MAKKREQARSVEYAVLWEDHTWDDGQIEKGVKGDAVTHGEALLSEVRYRKAVMLVPFNDPYTAEDR